MTNFDLTYNPFSKEKKFLVDGEEDSFTECWGEGNKELSEWCSGFFEKLYKKYNDSEMRVKFKGIVRDFEFLEDAKDAYEKRNEFVKIELIDNGCSNTTDKLGDLKVLFKKMQKETPFEELKSEEIRRIFDTCVSSEFEMAVVATMSSGKSTLINAMLGRELLPARNEATTATLAKIHDIDAAETYSGKSYDKDHNLLKSIDKLTLDNMNELNDDPKTSVIEIYGNIVGIESKDLQLILTDTPGPNNSRTEEHKNHTYSLLQEDYKPMILYVLNGTQLETNDDNSLLRDVANAMKSGGRQAQERFIFVLNKADEFDPGKGEDVPKKIEDVRKYLGKHGIENARIFPTASRMAKIIRQYQNDQPLTETEEDDILPKHTSFIKREWKHFSNFAPLSNSMKEKQNELIRNAQEKGNKYQEALMYTGVPAVELAISEYLAKYALPTKIMEGVYSFKEKIDNLGIEARETKKLQDNHEAVKDRVEKLEKIKAVLKNGDKAKQVRIEIEKISIKESVKMDFESIRSEMMCEYVPFSQKFRNCKMSLDEAEKNKKKIIAFFSEMEIKLKVKVEKTLKNVLKLQAETAINDYQKYLSDLVGEVSKDDIPPAGILGSVASVSVSDVLDDYVQSERVKVGSHRVKDSGIGGFFKRLVPFTDWGYHDVDDYETRKYVDFSDYISKEINPKFNALVRQTSEIAFKWADEESKKFVDFFKEKLNRLDDAIKLKIEEQEKNLKDKETFENMMKENEQNLEWLNGFKANLDSILAI